MPVKRLSWDVMIEFAVFWFFRCGFTRYRPFFSMVGRAGIEKLLGWYQALLLNLKVCGFVFAPTLTMVRTLAL